MSKAENLKKIKPKYVPPYTVIRHDQEIMRSMLLGTGDLIIQVIPDFFHIMEEANEKLYAVRSSATSEDGDDKSFAGMFLTKLNVEPQDVRDAIPVTTALPPLVPPRTSNFSFAVEVPIPTFWFLRDKSSK